MHFHRVITTSGTRSARKRPGPSRPASHFFRFEPDRRSARSLASGHDSDLCRRRYRSPAPGGYALAGGETVTAPVMAAVEAYIAMRHGLGYRSPTQERSLRAFARHLDTANHSGPISLASTLQWATATTSTDPCNPARRLATVRGFLRHLSALDGATEVPPVLPPGQGDALHMLAAGYSVEDAWAELVAGEDPGTVNQGDVDAALARLASQSMFYVVRGGDALLDVLSRPFDLWRTFLHPSQKRLAYQQHYGGPARVTGGGGTGKTVVALLAEQIPGADSNESMQITRPRWATPIS